jgi:ankyrin repeat and BTB/POZ domain-containing protein 1
MAVKEQTGQESETVEETSGINGVVRTLDGEIVEDEFDLDAQNYQILLQKIDVMLDKLKLNA